jgi:glyoxylase-like metal-dependent hydrolase (beta-lactamase superfamily II)
MHEIAGGIWRWTARHPEWHPGEWGAEVGCYALPGGGRTVLIDPLAPEGDEGFWEQLDGVVSGPVTCLITIGYHLRSAEDVCARYPGATVWGHGNVAKRMRDRGPFRELSPASTPTGVRAFAIGRPRRAELPVLVESHRAVAFGDAVVGTDEGLRMWCSEPVDEGRRRFYADRFAPTLAPILAEPFDHVLATHGPPAVGDGHAALAEAAAAPPWYHRG